MSQELNKTIITLFKERADRLIEDLNKSIELNEYKWNKRYCHILTCEKLNQKSIGLDETGQIFDLPQASKDKRDKKIHNQKVQLLEEHKRNQKEKRLNEMIILHLMQEKQKLKEAVDINLQNFPTLIYFSDTYSLDKSMLKEQIIKVENEFSEMETVD